MNMKKQRDIFDEWVLEQRRIRNGEIRYMEPQPVGISELLEMYQIYSNCGLSELKEQTWNQIMNLVPCMIVV